MKRSVSAFAIALAATVGCQPKATDDNGTESGLEINVPGAEVKVAPGEGVEVNAPGVDVKATSEGAEVHAPGVDVKASPTEGAKVDVNAGESK